MHIGMTFFQSDANGNSEIDSRAGRLIIRNIRGITVLRLLIKVSHDSSNDMPAILTSG